MVVLAGVGGLVAHQSGTSSSQPKATPAVPVPTTAGSLPVTPPTTPPTASQSVPSLATLQGDLIVANDLGGYYTPMPADSQQQLGASGCLAVLGQKRLVIHSAQQFLEGPYHGGLPLINETISAYGNVVFAKQAYTEVAAALRSCRAPTVSIYGNGVMVPLSPVALNPLGDQAIAYHGGYQLHGHAEELTVAVVRNGALIVVFVYADTVPQSNPALGSVDSTLAAVVGKTAD